MYSNVNWGNVPIFIVGVDRSGTTLLSLILDSHSRLAIPYESHFFIKYYKNQNLVGNLDCKKCRLRLVERILAEPYVARWEAKISTDQVNIDNCISLEQTIQEIYLAYARQFDKDMWGDKTPEYIREIHILNKMFPACKFVHIIRDGRDVATSIVDKWWGANDFVTAIRYWADSVSCARKMLSMLPENRCIELRFEDLLTNPKKEIMKVTMFLGIDFEEDMLADYQWRAAAKVGSKIDGHHSNLRKQISQSQAYKWQKKLGPADQAIAFEIAGNLLEELGYPAGVKAHPLKNIRKGYHRIKKSYEWRFRKRKYTER